MHLQHVTDPSAAAWLIASLDESLDAIGSLVPRGYAAYARVFAPIDERTDRTNTSSTWHALAQSVGLRLDVETPWAAFPPEIRATLQPLMGSLGPMASHLLAQSLLPHTAAPSDCFFALWVGYGGVMIPDKAATIVLPPDREMAIFQGGLALANENLEMEPFDRQSVRWWPASREWCVAGDIYSTSVVVGGSFAAIEAVCSMQGLEALTLDENSSIKVMDL